MKTRNELKWTDANYAAATYDNLGKWHMCVAQMDTTNLAGIIDSGTV